MCATFPRALRERSLRPVDAAMANQTCRFSVAAGRTVAVPGVYVGLARELISRRIYTWPKGFEVASGDVVLDLGANVGIFSLYAASRGAKVTSVEAQEGFLRLIRQLFNENFLTTPTCLHALVGGGTGVFESQNAQSAASHWGGEPERLNLDEILQRVSASEITLLKSDIEGSEFDLILNSKPETLKRVRKFAMEVHTQYGEPGMLKQRLEENGFDVILADSQPRRVDRIAGPFGFLYASRQDGPLS